MSDRRVKEFERNLSLETLLAEVNDNLWLAEREILAPEPAKHPFVFIFGAHRSGSTLLMQWLANTGLFSYPTNLLSRFYKAPVLGSKLQLLLADERFNFRDELKDFSSKATFTSSNGKTKGALEPNEFWYFWRRFLPFSDSVDFLSTERLNEVVDKDLLVRQLSGLANVLGKPFAAKAMILNYNIDFLYQLFPNSVFIHLKRDPVANVVSGLKARERQLGSVDAWYSFKIPEYDELKDLSAEKQVAGQVYYINKAVEAGFRSIPADNRLDLQYEEFCQCPADFWIELSEKLANLGCKLSPPERMKQRFEVTNAMKPSQAILDAWAFFNVEC
ncbi:hypothetical protein A3762_09950 [Oleiphilus sp. HI0125]|uniref:sulfotransferase n=1 Tax=Oleiphilus sp. HI0125 TaxID=1822266 RepID=UPI0007C303DD|nr:sulfotransferase [Oleiphilus sp. HI0125]KZZ57485.1 hypothetical protein A3762_09950 [Oleiphilus sp. HI0125]